MLREISNTDTKPSTILSNGQEAGFVAYMYIRKLVFKQQKNRIQKKIKKQIKKLKKPKKKNEDSNCNQSKS